MEQWERNWKDYYKILQVDFSAEPEVIDAAYKNLVKKYHPDRNSKTGDRMKDLNEASEVLCDPEKKSGMIRSGLERVVNTQIPEEPTHLPLPKNQYR